LTVQLARLLKRGLCGASRRERNTDFGITFEARKWEGTPSGANIPLDHTSSISIALRQNSLLSWTAISTPVRAVAPMTLCGANF
jgi:hypothetical protein